jgi:hypothetical protein
MDYRSLRTGPRLRAPGRRLLWATGIHPSPGRDDLARRALTSDQCGSFASKLKASWGVSGGISPLRLATQDRRASRRSR